MPANPETCVFSDVTTPGFTKPTYQGKHGECFATVGEQMSGCCFHAAENLLLLNDIKTADEIRQTLKKKDRSTQSKLKGITNAFQKHS